jgi:hypothetical protein
MSTLSTALKSVAAELSKFRALHEFNISLPREIEEEVSRVEGDKTITEKTKVTRTISIPFALKKPSRFEKDEADIYRSVWETRYLDAGIAPSAILLKKYANYGGILSNEQKDYYNTLQRDFLLAESELRRLQVNERDNKVAIDDFALKMVTLRQAILDFQQEQSVFFNNTSEAKARQKLVEWLVLYLTYYRPLNDKGEPGEWTPFFAGATIEDKLEAFDEIVEKNDEMWNAAHDLIELIATVYANGGERDIPDVVAMSEPESK